MMCINLDELPSLFDPFWLWSARRFNLSQFRRSDHLAGKPDLKQTVLDRVENQLGCRPNGKVLLLTHLRYFGYIMNPVSFYYCFEQDQKTLRAVVAEVHNTPWGEQHAYVLDAQSRENDLALNRSGLFEFKHDKEFHVSPFLPMDMQYHWRVSKPDDKLCVHIENRQHEEVLFNVSMHLTSKPITRKSLALAIISFPFMTLKVLLAIYFEAFRLWLLKTPFFPHP